MAINRGDCAFTTTITWYSDGHQGNKTLETLRTAQLDTMANVLNLTDGVPDFLSNVSTVRYWKDQTAAETYATFITEQCNNLAIPTPEIVVTPR